MTTQTTEVDYDLAAAVRATTRMRTAFYVVVLLIALGGQVSGAMEALAMPWYVALPAVGALELGGMVVLANADVRRRLGEHATLSRLLSAAIAGGAVAFNWLAHDNHLEGGFYGGMSLLGYLVWLMNTENKRRDRLRAKRQLPPTPPAYGLLRWIRHPWLTQRARQLALATPALGLYGSLDAAAVAVRTERRQAALAKVLGKRIEAVAGKEMAAIAVATYDLDALADQVGARADLPGLAALIADDLTPAKLAGKQTTQDDLTAIVDAAAPTLDETVERVVARQLADIPAVESAAVASRIHPTSWRAVVGRRPRRLTAKTGPVPVVVVAGPKVVRADKPTPTGGGSEGSRAPAKRTASTAEKVAAAAKKPGTKQADVAERLKVSLRTVERYWPKVGATAVNGSSGAPS